MHTIFFSIETYVYNIFCIWILPKLPQDYEDGRSISSNSAINTNIQLGYVNVSEERNKKKISKTNISIWVGPI